MAQPLDATSSSHHTYLPLEFKSSDWALARVRSAATRSDFFVVEAVFMYTNIDKNHGVKMIIAWMDEYQD